MVFNLAENDTYWTVSSTGPDVMDYYVDSTLVLSIVGAGGTTANDTYQVVSSTSPDVLDYYVNGSNLVRIVG